MQIVGYTRVSTDEQTASGAGMAAQRDAIAREADRRGWRVVAIYEDGGASGRSLDGRPGLSAALSAVAAGDADALVVAKLDRLSRSLHDFAALMERSREEGWALVALDVNVDTSTAQGEMLVGVLATFAQFERRLIGQRTREALAVRRAEGVRLGRPPSIPNSVRARILDERAHGRTFRAIAARLNEEAVPTTRDGRRWYAETVRKVCARHAHAAAEAAPGP